jgi:hypothetical protein
MMTPRMEKLEAKFRQPAIQERLKAIEVAACNGEADQYAERDRLHDELIRALAPEFYDGGDGYAFEGGSNCYLVENITDGGSCDYEYEAGTNCVTLNCHDDAGDTIERYIFRFD